MFYQKVKLDHSLISSSNTNFVAIDEIQHQITIEVTIF
jgi:hypothetical protein